MKPIVVAVAACALLGAGAPTLASDQHHSVVPADAIMPPASFIHLPAGMAHYAWAKAESVVQINGVGPFDVTYLNPADDPRKQ
jgi:hypothetical protein